MKLVFRSFAMLLFFMVFQGAFADDNFGDQQLKTFSDNISEMGTTFTKNGNEISIYVDQEKSLNRIPGLQKIGVMNPDITQTQINENPVFNASYVGLLSTLMITREVYEDTNIDKANFKVYYSSPDDYGNMKKYLIFTFNFDRKLYKKINWDNFEITNFIKVAPGFTFSDWYQDKTGVSSF